MKPTNLLRILLLVSILSTTYITSLAQGWEKKYSPNRQFEPVSLFQLHDGSYFTSDGSIGNFATARLMKIASNGAVLWAKDYDSLSQSTYGRMAQNGGYMIIGYTVPNTINSTRAILRLDSNGNKLWLKYVPGIPTLRGNGGLVNMGMDTTNNGGIIFAFNTYDSAGITPRKEITRIDGSGNTVWTHTYFDADTDIFINDIRNANDGGFIATLTQNGPSHVSSLVKIDSAGTIQWQYPIPFAQANIFCRMAKDGNILFYGAYTVIINNPISYIGKLNLAGTQLSLKSYTTLTDTINWYEMIENADGTYESYGIKGNRFYLIKADTAGNILLQKRVPLNYQTTVISTGRTFTATNDGGYAIACWLNPKDDQYSMGIIKMGANGEVYPHFLSGNLYYDANNSCARDTMEFGVDQSVLTFTNSTDTFNVSTNNVGHYSVGLNNGTYHLEAKPLLHYTTLAPCISPQINITGVDSIIDLPLVPTVSSPYVNVDGNTRQRPCVPLTYTAHYCNNGTASFTGGIDVTFDSLVVVDSASKAWVLPQTGTAFRFLIDTLAIMDCADIVVHYHLPCDPTLLGRTICVDADVFADTVVNPSPNWDRSNLVISGKCNTATDSVEFILENIGTGNMQGGAEMIVIEDNVISVKSFAALVAGGQFQLAKKANGATWRATVKQSPNNPYSSFTTAAVEGCGVNQQGSFSKGFYLQYPNNGNYAFHYSTCSVVVNSLDPNHKSVVPTGAGENHLIDSTAELEYTIDFQNTGTDTAYMMRLVDTLASYLDVSTIKLGVSSHPYTMELSDNNILTFLFYNIMLPDSGHNQVGSNGFAKFKIKQKPNNVDGTVINNNAAIYFDYNTPIITNTATVKLGQVLVSGIENLYEEKAVTINAYPNPFDNHTVIKVDGENFDQLQLTVYDINGKIALQQVAYHANQFTLSRASMGNGTYLFEIRNHNKLVGRGKIVAQ